MEPDNPEDRPESPKKKIRPSSTTNSDFQPSDSRDATDGEEIHAQSILNGVAPTRRDRRFEACSSSEKNDNDSKSKEASIQEEVVSSSENTVQVQKNPPSYSVGDADSLTNDAEDSNHVETERSALSHNSEAEHKEL